MSTATPLPLEPTLVGSSPDFYSQVDNFLPADAYQELYDSFPDESWFSSVIEGDKKRISTRESPEVFEKFCGLHPEWQQLFDQLGSEAFMASLYGLLKAPLNNIRGSVGGRAWTFNKRSLLRPQDWFKREAVVGFEFSRLEAGSFVPPHTDAPEKLATLILYFTPPEWQPEWGGDTLLYKPKNEALKRNWHNRRIPFDGVETEFTNGYIGNRLFIFTKSEASLHGVPTIECPAGVARTSLNINVLLPPVKRFRRLRKKAARRARQREQRNHPE